jgi:hypothetical protein
MGPGTESRNGFAPRRKTKPGQLSVRKLSWFSIQGLRRAGGIMP